MWRIKEIHKKEMGGKKWRKVKDRINIIKGKRKRKWRNKNETKGYGKWKTRLS